MSFKNLKEFIEIAKTAGASELEYEDGDKKFSVAFPTASSHVVQPAINTQIHSSPNALSESTIKDPGIKEITSPFVGTFYKSSSPETGPYVKIGDKISQGKVLCIVEAMKIMNEIESEISGEIVEICVENENYVEFGQVLFRVRA